MDNFDKILKNYHSLSKHGEMLLTQVVPSNELAEFLEDVAFLEDKSYAELGVMFDHHGYSAMVGDQIEDFAGRISEIQKEYDIPDTFVPFENIKVTKAKTFPFITLLDIFVARYASDSERKESMLDFLGDAFIIFIEVERQTSPIMKPLNVYALRKRK